MVEVKVAVERLVVKLSLIELAVVEGWDVLELPLVAVRVAELAMVVEDRVVLELPLVEVKLSWYSPPPQA